MRENEVAPEEEEDIETTLEGKEGGSSVAPNVDVLIITSLV